MNALKGRSDVKITPYLTVTAVDLGGILQEIQTVL